MFDVASHKFPCLRIALNQMIHLPCVWICEINMLQILNTIGTDDASRCNAVTDIEVVARIVTPEGCAPSVLRVTVAHREVEHVTSASFEALARLTVKGIEIRIARLDRKVTRYLMRYLRLNALCACLGNIFVRIDII